MTELDTIYRERGYVCRVCNEPYKTAYIYPKTKEIRCKQCWTVSDSLCSNYWYHSPINEEMEQLELVDKYNKGEIPEDDLDVQNQFAYEAIVDGRWEDALENFERNKDRRDDWGKWNNMSKYILVQACEQKDCPIPVLEYLMSKGGPRKYETRPCINPGGIGSMNILAVAAEKGNLNAIEVILDTNWSHDLHWAIVCAFRANQGQAFDILLNKWISQKGYINENTHKDKEGWLTYYLGFDFALYRMIHTATGEGLDQSLRVIKKYIGDHSDIPKDVVQWP